MIVDYLGNRYPSYDTFTRGRIWKIRRGRWLRDHKPYCRACFGTGRLDRHHFEYVEGELGNEPDDGLVALCHGRLACHFTAHAYVDSGAYPISKRGDRGVHPRQPNHRRKAKARRAGSTACSSG